MPFSKNKKLIEMTLHKELFLSKYHISNDEFVMAGTTWKSLVTIYNHYEQNKHKYSEIAQVLSNNIATAEGVHSTRFRVKNSEHLIEKIIRKNIGIKNPKDKIDISNYLSKITDIVGIRALHLFKKDWITIDEFIRSSFTTIETPKAYFREGDDPEIIKIYSSKNCNVERHNFGYRSIHYTIKYQISNKISSICEIQVRTLFEEGWSEIDHRVNYPHRTENKALSSYLGILNKICGNADDMATFVELFDFSNTSSPFSSIIEFINQLNIDYNIKTQIIDKLKEQKTKLTKSITI